MSTSNLKKAWTQVLEALNKKHKNLDQDFMEDVRSQVEKAYAPLMSGGGSGDGKQKKKRGIMGFNVFIREFSSAHKDDPPTKGPDGKDFTLFKLASVDWGKMDDKAKSTFYKMAAEENAKNGIVPASKRPKKPMNGYNFFIQEYKSKNSQQGGGTDLFKQAAGSWSKMSEKQKESYKVKATAANKSQKETEKPASKPTTTTKSTKPTRPANKATIVKKSRKTVKV